MICSDDIIRPEDCSSEISRPRGHSSGICGLKTQNLSKLERSNWRDSPTQYLSKLLEIEDKLDCLRYPTSKIAVDEASRASLAREKRKVDLMPSPAQYLGFLLWLCLCGAFSKQGMTQDQPATRSERTEDVHRKWIKDMTAKQYKFFALNESQVKVKSQDPCGVDANALNTSKDGFKTLSLQERLCLQIDDHGDAYLVIESIRATEVSLRYEYKFDHGSFGSAKQSVDQGVFQVTLQAKVPTGEQLPGKKLREHPSKAD